MLIKLTKTLPSSLDSVALRHSSKALVVGSTSSQGLLGLDDLFLACFFGMVDVLDEEAILLSLKVVVAEVERVIGLANALLPEIVSSKYGNFRYYRTEHIYF